MQYEGYLNKMKSQLLDSISYKLVLDDEIPMNDLLGKQITFQFLNEIQCVSCKKIIKKSFNQGFCYTCFMNAPESSECIIRPELCRAHLNEGRNITWELEHHNQPHVVYLAATDSIKVGVTRKTQVPTRWIDQGANQAIILAETPNRYLAGVMEVELKNHFTDKTNWQKMLKNQVDDYIDLVSSKWELEDILPEDLLQYFTEDEEVYSFDYPVLKYMNKVLSFTFDKEDSISGVLIGIKGQYLLFDDSRVINIRKHTGYRVRLTV